MKTKSGLSDEDKKKYLTVREKFTDHFVKKRNVIFERAKFQHKEETVDNFVTDLRTLFSQDLQFWRPAQ